MAWFSGFKRLGRDFARDRGGNVAMIFALSLVPIMGIIGITVDYSRASTANRLLADAVDSAALMGARDAMKLTDDQIKTRVSGWIKANLHGDAASTFTADTAIDRTARTVTVKASATVTMGLSSILGQSTMPVSVQGQSSWGLNKIELAMVLDNTGSMSQNGKMTALKAASLDLIKTMQTATQETDQIKISIVPFTTQVKVSTSLKDANWLRWTETQQQGCNWVYSNGWQYVCQTKTIDKSSWQGCVTDRDQNYDVSDSSPDPASNTQLYPADFCDQTTLTEIMPLTTDWSALNARVNAMNPNGNTNVTIGAIWGAATLSPSSPYTEGQAYNTPRLTKYMILLTDGDNTQNRFSSNQTDIDARTKMACTNIKNMGIRVYTIRVMDGNASLLQGCASDPSMYYNVTNASQLSPVFKQIAGEISQVRLTQ